MLFAPKEKGQGLVEYALILVLVAIVVIAVLMLLGPIIGNVFSTINTSLSSSRKLELNLEDYHYINIVLTNWTTGKRFRIITCQI